MFEKLFDIIIHFANEIFPFKIINQWEKGVLLRFGKYKRTLEPGLRFKTPFVNHIITVPVITQTVNLRSQTVTSLDKKCIVLSSIVRYHIDDIEKYMFTVMHANDVLVDTTQGIIRDIVESTELDHLVELGSTVQSAVNEQVKKWGITVEQVSFPDLAQIRTYRIISDRPHNF